METIKGSGFKKPFPHLIFSNFYNEQELNLIWEELNFYTKPNKLFEAKDFGGIIDRTNSHAIALDGVYSQKYRRLSNILTVNRKLFTSDVLESFAKIDDCCQIANECNYDVTKIRYYHDKEYYKPHIDSAFHFLAFSYFYKEPKKFSGGEIIFPKYDYEYSCENNSVIIFPGWVEHGVTEVSIDNSDYYEGYGRYCISSFFGCESKK
tara:strand:+ start:33 stop:653 length:621 start_codon:yes stop_codon:yes gene_type:complete